MSSVTGRTRISVAQRFAHRSAGACLGAIRAARVRCLSAGQELVRAHYALRDQDGVDPTADDLIEAAGRQYTPPRSKQDRRKFWWDYLLVNLQRGILEISQATPATAQQVADPPRMTERAGARGVGHVSGRMAHAPTRHREESEDAWIDALLQSQRYETQRQKHGRAVLPEARVRECLWVLAERRGKLTRAALAQHLGVNLARATGIVAALRRLLNVDGYPVLALDEASDTVELNRELLRVQFEIRL